LTLIALRAIFLVFNHPPNKDTTMARTAYKTEMEFIGFKLEDTGGGCMAWTRTEEDGTETIIGTGENAPHAGEPVSVWNDNRPITENIPFSIENVLKVLSDGMVVSMDEVR
jgi:N6-adenosine-specific RNA methylase IME4